jgi:hypothetical protein
MLEGCRSFDFGCRKGAGASISIIFQANNRNRSSGNYSLAGAVDATGAGRVRLQPAKPDGLAAGCAVAIVSRGHATEGTIDFDEPTLPAPVRFLRDRLLLHGIHACQAANAGLVELYRPEIFASCLPDRLQLGFQRD